MKQRTTRSRANTITYIAIAILCLIGLGVKKCMHGCNAPSGNTTTTTAGSPGVSVSEEWRHHKLIYTKHARCRMECRDITEGEVEQILAGGTINEQKSKEENDEAEGHCPSFALEGTTTDGQHVRIVFGACDKITKVITAIDLDKEHVCDCK